MTGLPEPEVVTEWTPLEAQDVPDRRGRASRGFLPSPSAYDVTDRSGGLDLGRDRGLMVALPGSSLAPGLPSAGQSLRVRLHTLATISGGRFPILRVSIRGLAGLVVW